MLTHSTKWQLGCFHTTEFDTGLSLFDVWVWLGEVHSGLLEMVVYGLIYVHFSTLLAWKHSALTWLSWSSAGRAYAEVMGLISRECKHGMKMYSLNVLNVNLDKYDWQIHKHESRYGFVLFPKYCQTVVSGPRWAVTELQEDRGLD